MEFSEYLACDGLALAQRVRSGKTTARELAETALGAADGLNPQLNCIVETYPERANGLDAVQPSDGPLADVPILIEDLGVREEGTVCGRGSRLASGLCAPTNSDLMVRFRRAGLVNLGRTATPEFGYSCSAESEMNGKTRNPWYTDRMAGGGGCRDCADRPHERRLRFDPSVGCVLRVVRPETNPGPGSAGPGRRCPVRHGRRSRGHPQRSRQRCRSGRRIIIRAVPAFPGRACPPAR